MATALASLTSRARYTSPVPPDSTSFWNFVVSNSCSRTYRGQIQRASTLLLRWPPRFCLPSLSGASSDSTSQRLSGSPVHAASRKASRSSLVAPNWTEKSGTASAEAMMVRAQPQSLTFDSSGNLYNTGAGGGTSGTGCGGSGCGVVFELENNSSGWTQKTLHSLGSARTGQCPTAV
jgi:hypothetical protein